ncbi:glycoside hydrolase family 16 protein [Phanerochaete sordida]|uniref:Glycoside hydrolase family 16 protein n=1 Tax=Phanerochaete sordida TaxID=48140 RepID=A0A9P3LN26_9APHY|nr:glycoside hydrolase family 16 protein [Phanerochaete sordida]
MLPRVLGLVLLAQVLCATAAQFNLTKEYSGSSFFDDWDYYGAYDASTYGAEVYVTKAQAGSLTSVSPAGHALIRLDNTTDVPYPGKRNSVRLTTQQWFGVGTLWVVDAIHIPFGCSVWPAIWTSGANWPNNGEIDIIEGVNQVAWNQMSIHAAQGCTVPPSPKQSGNLTEGDCSQGVGCVVEENTPNSYGKAFADNGGGVWAAQYDSTGIFIWFWPRNKLPANLQTPSDTLDISSWGTPSAAYASPTCNITEFFGGQQMIIDIALCGEGADSPGVYAQTCGDTQTNACYLDNVINNGSAAYADAYFELAAIRAFSPAGTTTVFGSAAAAGVAPGPNGTATAGAPAASGSSGGGGGGSGGGAAGGGSGGATGGALRLGTGWELALFAGGVGALGALL